jgi:uncharacterized membrane protein
MNQNNTSTNMILHLGRLSDTIFALAMALTIFGFDFPKFATSINNTEIDQFLILQLEPLGNYLITFVILAFYWIDHVKQFSYYQRTNEIHLWLYLAYLMCLFIIPYSNVLIAYFPQNAIIQISYSINVFIIGFFSFLNWTYATYKHKLVDENLDINTIKYIRITSLIEPTVALITIIVALIKPSLWDISWASVIIFYILAETFIKKSVDTQLTDDSNNDNKSEAMN